MSNPATEFGKGQDPHLIHRPRVEMDLDEVEKLCGLQCTQADLAAWFNVTTQTIENRFKEDKLYDYHGEQMTFRQIAERGYGKGRVSLRRAQMKAADDGQPTMLVWLGKNILGQRDNIEVTGPAAGPIEIATTSASDKIASELARLAERERAASDPEQTLP